MNTSGFFLRKLIDLEYVMKSNQKYIVTIMFVVSVLVAVSVQGLMIPVLAKNEIGDPLILGGFRGSTLAVFILGIGVFFALNRHPLIVNFSNNVVTELRRVFWPDKEETVRFTTIVIGVTLFIAFMLGLYDFVWGEVTERMLYSA